MFSYLRRLPTSTVCVELEGGHVCDSTHIHHIHVIAYTIYIIYIVHMRRAASRELWLWHNNNTNCVTLFPRRRSSMLKTRCDASSNIPDGRSPIIDLLVGFDRIAICLYLCGVNKQTAWAYGQHTIMLRSLPYHNICVASGVKVTEHTESGAVCFLYTIWWRQ